MTFQPLDVRRCISSLNLYERTIAHLACMHLLPDLAALRVIPPAPVSVADVALAWCFDWIISGQLAGSALGHWSTPKYLRH